MATTNFAQLNRRPRGRNGLLWPEEAAKVAARLRELADAIEHPLNTQGAAATCPQCGTPTATVTGKTRDDPDIPAVRQSQAECQACGRLWWTYL